MKKLQLASLTFIFALLLSGCIKDNFDAPESTCLDLGQNITNIIDIATLKSGYSNTTIDLDAYVKATVTGDDRSGNIYKNLYVSDGTGSLAIAIDITNAYTKFPVGRTIYLKLNGLYILNSEIGIGPDGSYAARIPALFIDDYIIKGACGDMPEPLAVSIDQLGGVETGTLIKIENVEFVDGLDGITYANAVQQSTENRDITDCFGNTMIVRSSGYSDFAGTLLAAGNGSIVGIYNVFGSDKQLFIRSLDDVDMTATRCDGSSPNQNIVLSKNFEDGSITSGGWTIQTPVGTFDWGTDTQGGGQQGTTYAKASNFAGGNTAAETWMISPSIDISAETNPIFKFTNAYNYSGAPLEVLISTDYDGTTDPNDATWSSLNPVLSTGGWDWVSSGNIDLSLYQTGPFYIGFKYTGSNSDGSTWEVDAIQIVAD